MLYEPLKLNSHFSNHRNYVRLHRLYKKAFVAIKIEEKVKITSLNICKSKNMPNQISFCNFSLVCIFLQNGR